MKRCSSLTFNDLIENLNFVKIIYNKEVIYDDLCGEETIEHLNEVINSYCDKIIYEMKIKVVDFHHCILTIKGEE